MPSQSVDSLLGLALRAGETNLRVMELLDAGSTTRYGHPKPTPVRLTPVTGKCIAVSGHDLRGARHAPFVHRLWLAGWLPVTPKCVGVATPNRLVGARRSCPCPFQMHPQTWRRS